MTAGVTASSCSPAPSVTWTATPATTATVSAAGLVTGVAVGSATITASALGVSGSTTINITQPPPATVAVTPATGSLASIGETTQLAAEAKDVFGVAVPNTTFTWATSNAAVAAVSSTGLVTAVGVGAVTITATIGALSATANLSVTQVAASITVSPGTASLASLGETTALTGTVKDARGNAMAASPTWTSSATGVATVSTAGVVTAVTNGTTTITAAFGTFNAATTVTVAQVPASITVAPAAVTINALGGTASLTATVKDARGNTMAGTPAWASSNAPSATISAAGIATAVANGSSNISATLGSASGTGVVSVVQAVADLAFTVQPGNTTANAVLAPNMKVSLRDSRGNVATNSIASVTLTISTNPLGGSLAGTVTRNAVAGVADFTGVSVNKRGTGYKLTAAALGFSTISSAFNIDRSAADPGLKITSFQIHNAGGTCADVCTGPGVSVPAGSTVVGSIVGTLWNQSSCAGCITQFVTGFGGTPSVCYDGGTPAVYPGTAVSTSGATPSPTPTATGTYLMRVRITQQFSCGAAALADYASSPPPAEDGLGYVVTTNTGDYTTALTNIKLNGAPIVAVVSSGQTVALTLNYQLWTHPTCANCSMQILIGVGATAHTCVYDGVPGVSPGASGTSTINITAPTAPGTYEIRYRQNLESSCGTAKTQYNSFPPGTAAAIGTIIVKP